MLSHTIHRLATRIRPAARRAVSYDETAGGACTPLCRRESQLDSHHWQAEYYTLIHR